MRSEEALNLEAKMTSSKWLLALTFAIVFALSSCYGSFATIIKQPARNDVELTFRQYRLGGYLMRFLGSRPLEPCIFRATVSNSGRIIYLVQAQKGLCEKVTQLNLGHLPPAFEANPETLNLVPGRTYSIAVFASIGQSNARFTAR
jgi:hypothetical protein